mgnify:CR=1 FL=1
MGGAWGGAGGEYDMYGNWVGSGMSTYYDEGEEEEGVTIDRASSFEFVEVYVFFT